MKKILFLFLLLSFSGFSKDKKLKAYLDTKQFFSPQIGNYVEFHLQFVGPSINYEGKDDGLIGSVVIKMSIAQNDSIITSDVYRLSTPFMKDSIIEDFYDIKRFALKPGEYDFTISLLDPLSSEKAQTATQPIIVEDLDGSISISDLQMAETAFKGDQNSPFFKSGYNIIPRISNYYPHELTGVLTYFEVYNSTSLGEHFGLKQAIIDAKTGLEIEKFTRYTKHKSAPVVPVLKNLNIEQLPSGNYTLEFTLINSKGTELSKQSYDFERSNNLQEDFLPNEIILDPNFQASIKDDSIGFYLESLIPIATPQSTRNIIKIAKSKNSQEARKFIQQFWAITSPGNPYESWMQYKAQVDLVERKFRNNFQEGFETDRGRVYLKYGSPNNIISQTLKNASEYPYEIWQYDKIGRFSNKQFIFYNPDLVGERFRLLHSNMLGEQSNPGWQSELNRPSTRFGTTDDPNAGHRDHFGGNSDDYMRRW